MAAGQQTATLAFAQVTRRGWLRGEVPFRPSELMRELRRTITTAVEAERYGRRWIAEVNQSSPEWIAGRLGFQKADEEDTIWDEERQQFIEAPRVYGRTSPFALHLPSGVVAFQLRRGQIQPSSFSGALQQMIREQSDDPEWVVVHVSQEEAWSSFLSRMDAIVEFHAHVVRPNPNWFGRPLLEDFVERIRAQVLDVVAKADPDDGALDVDDDLILEVIEHAAQQRKSRYWARGRREGDGAVDTWRSNEQGAQLTGTVPLPSGQHEVPVDLLQSEALRVSEQTEVIPAPTADQDVPSDNPEPDVLDDDRPPDIDLDEDELPYDLPERSARAARPRPKALPPPAGDVGRAADGVAGPTHTGPSDDDADREGR